MVNKFYSSHPAQELATQYWAPLVPYLTHLQLSMTDDSGPAPYGISALCQLTTLQELRLAGAHQRWEDVSFSFPQLTRMYIETLQLAELKIDCPQLLHIQLEDIGLEHLSGLGSSLKSMVLKSCMRNFAHNEGLLPSFAMGRLVGLQSLEICTESNDISTKVTDEELLRSIRYLTSLTSLMLKDMYVESQALPTVLPASLQQLGLDISDANEGIPHFIEALPSLQRLCLSVAAEDTKLTRSLTPFLQMTGLTSLEFSLAAAEAGMPAPNWIAWEPQALQLIAQALIQIQDSGSQLQLKY